MAQTLLASHQGGRGAVHCSSTIVQYLQHRALHNTQGRVPSDTCLSKTGDRTYPLHERQKITIRHSTSHILSFCLGYYINLLQPPQLQLKSSKLRRKPRTTSDGKKIDITLYLRVSVPNWQLCSLLYCREHLCLDSRGWATVMFQHRNIRHCIEQHST